MVRKQNVANKQDVVRPDVRIPNGMGVLNPVADTTGDVAVSNGDGNGTDTSGLTTGPALNFTLATAATSAMTIPIE
ncbi:hypothetical protein LTR24_007959 [Lithohypha guttulata]|uniref:Uncharacterized protein n=1 Tax=Lithohypha guttulata TaxID=1690604 RepID=A0ABR0K1C9_9EURO|nr:hypothetical protein LTR24_007959 [Lithohypha guttulata]